MHSVHSLMDIYDIRIVCAEQGVHSQTNIILFGPQQRISMIFHTETPSRLAELQQPKPGLSSNFSMTDVNFDHQR